ncbi:MAG: hypothetical protein JOY71_03560 [Acetobacteraceae bacterium]|nr:hypothetical protein [Acetobacteraceae bacterium]
MRAFFLTSVSIVLLCAVPALAQTQPSTGGPSGQQNMGSQSQMGAGGGGTAIQQRLSQDLQRAGFRDIHIMPGSFLVRAKNKDGMPVMMIINPDSVTAITEVTPSGAGQGGGSTGGGTMPPGTAPSAGSSSGSHSGSSH